MYILPKSHHKLNSITSHLGILRAFRIPSTLWVLRKNGETLNPVSCPWVQQAQEYCTVVGYTLVPSWAHLEPCTLVCCLLLVSVFWLTCWVHLSNSTWRLWPTSTSAMQRSSTVWTSWSTWQVSIVARDTANCVDLLGVEHDVPSRKKDTCFSHWRFTHMGCAFVPADGFSNTGPHVFPWQLFLWQAYLFQERWLPYKQYLVKGFYLSTSVKMSDFSFLLLKFG